MVQNLAQENLIRSYFLGELSQNEQDEFEKRLLADPEFLQTLRIIEWELLDDYVLEALSESDRMNLESRLLMSAQQQRKVQLIRLLRLKSNASVFVKKRSLFSRYFRSYRSGLDQLWRVALRA
jgi:anti-sigma-K factor RskA